ncbi:MAG TPA: efflux RND transporter periplasmic adaptor subunit [Gemmataceae bacterium]|jgi:RND family efflux transporter MFP subunit|nr:efflux RND transporter periplasmic adaptor subunit [Gemmataceae bacterium]
MANTQADLSSLSVRRESTGVQLRLPRRWASRVVLPLVLIGGFVALVVWAAFDLIVPPLDIRVVAVQVRTGVVDESAAEELFKANGWIEPRPLPVDVPVQTEGMYRVSAVRVNPGDKVHAGQELVKLDDTSARLALETAQIRRARRKAATRSAEADASKADVALKNAVVAIGLAKAEGDADIRAQDALVVKAEAMLAGAEFTVKVEEDLRKSGALNSDVKVQQARLLRDAARAEVDSAKATLAKAQSAAAVRIRLAESAKAAAEADVASMKAKVEEAVQEAADAAIEIKKAQLEIDRTRITAPIDGVVMQHNIRVGTVLGGKGTLPEHKDAVVTLYEPSKLQVRVEVPIGKFQFVRYGQPAIVEVEDVLPGRKLVGTVLYDTHLANIARNSVPVKVALPDNPPEQLRPEMIASVRFQAPAQKQAPKGEAVRRVVVPRRLLVAEGDAVKVWIVEQARNRAELRTIELAPGEKERTGETAEVVGGLNPTDKLIATGLEQMRPGLRVRITGEDR